MRSISKITVVGVSTAALLGGGVALAAWTSNGEGSGTVTAGSATVLTVAQTGTSGALLPGGTQNLSFTINNPGQYAVTLSDLSITSIKVTGAEGCTVANSAVTAASLSNLTDTIAAGASVTKAVEVSMGAGSANACQGATFTFNAKAVGVSS